MKGKAYSISISGKNQELIEYLNGLTKKDLLSKVFTEVMDRHRLNEREQIEYDISILEKQIEEKKELIHQLPGSTDEQIASIESFDRMSFKMLINNLRMKGKDKEADKKIDEAIESGFMSKEDGRTIYGRGN